jgi:DNA-binding XRE family transcriptional regulator
MTNIFKELRQESGLTVSSLALLAGVSRFYIIKLEDLLYSELEPSSAVARIIASHLTRADLAPLRSYGIPSEPSPQAVALVYSAAIAANRLRLSRLVPPVPAGEWERIITNLVNISTDTSKYYPHVLLRKEIFRLYQLWTPSPTSEVWANTSQVYYCKMCNVHPAILSKYESGGSASMSDSIEWALRRLQIPEVLIAWCDERTRTKIEYLGGPSPWGNKPNVELAASEAGVGTGDD